MVVLTGPSYPVVAVNDFLPCVPVSHLASTRTGLDSKACNFSSSLFPNLNNCCVLRFSDMQPLETLNLKELQYVSNFPSYMGSG